MSEDATAALSSAADETIVLPAKPSQAQRLAYFSAGSTSAPRSAGRSLPLETLWRAMTGGRACPLVSAAAPLLDLCGNLATQAPADVEQLRLDALREINKFEIRIAPLQMTTNIVRISKYVLCATIDDLVLNTSWGSRSIWTKRSLVATVFGETWGGDRFFDILSQLKKEPHVNVDLLELIYYCLSLGFEGRYRVADRGVAELAVLKEDLYRLLRNVRGAFERDISPHWRGIGNARSPSRTVSPWLVLIGALVFLAALYAYLAGALAERKIGAASGLANLPPRVAVTIARLAPAPPPEKVVVLQVDELRRFLEPEIAQGLVAVKEDAQTISVLIRGKGMFESASADVIAGFTPLLERIGEALNSQPGTVAVVGHTDNTPIKSRKFPSNNELSLARAKTVALIIGARMRDPKRLLEEGRGDSEPIADNDTVEGRQQNRRIELIVTKESKL